jgi:type II secretory pathway pseudopilin PulG
MSNGTMRFPALVVLSIALAVAATTARAASTEADYKAAYATAEAANNEASKLRNQWTTAVSALKDAKKAAEAGDFDKAVAQSKKSETLSKAAIFQFNEQKDAWRKLEIR